VFQGTHDRSVDLFVAEDAAGLDALVRTTTDTAKVLLELYETTPETDNPGVRRYADAMQAIVDAKDAYDSSESAPFLDATRAAAEAEAAISSICRGQ
jgi:hypothetical protein